jgi:threonylcarbamoyladenosine tRNA methylthiotransferase MtaB
MKTVKFFTLGCKVNQYDTQSIRERFVAAGYKEISNGRPAGVCLINTCTVTSVADRKSRDTVRRCIGENPRARIIVTGCLVKDAESHLKEIKGIDYIISKAFFPSGISDFSHHTRAFLKIQDGCDNFCSYCKVPIVRGRSRSRPIAVIVDEARALAQKGFKEIVLSGICLGAYGRDISPRSSLVEVITALEDIEGLLRIRLSSIEAKDVSKGLIEKMKRSKKLCHHLHIPIQSGDAAILKKMNRRYTPSSYLGLIGKIKKNIPDIAITTDCLVGFPGETERQFLNTAELVKKILPLRTHVFPYSRREGTSSALNAKSHILPQEMRRRTEHLRDVASVCSLRYKEKFIGSKQDVLFECRCKHRPGFWEGYTGNYIKVLLKSQDRCLNNEVLSVRLVDIQEDYVIARRCREV